MPVNNNARPLTDSVASNQASTSDDQTVMAYTQRLQECQLDRSMASLKRLDLLLSQVRHELLEKKVTEAAFLLQPSGRRFLLFVGRYAGQVLADQWQQTVHWLTVPEISEIIDAVTPNLAPQSVVNGGFYQQLACQYNQEDQQTALFDTIIEITSVFFPLEVVGARVFASLDRPFTSITGEPVDSSLFQAVRKRSPATTESATDTSRDLAKETAAMEIAQAIARNKSLSQQNETLSITGTSPITDTPTAEANNASLTDPTIATAVNPKATATALPKSAISSQEQPATAYADSTVHISPDPDSRSQLDTNPIPAIVSPTSPSNTVNTSAEPMSTTGSLTALAAVRPSDYKAPILAADPLTALHTDLLKDLSVLDRLQSAGVDDYQKAVKILDIFEGFVVAQKKPRSEVKLSASHTELREEAVALLSASAEQGHTAAMLRLAMQKMLGEGTEKDLAEGASWVQKAASRDDARAQRLLSKLYYQGLGLTQDLTLGKHWLEQAAKNGHLEAQQLVEQWQQVEALTNVQKQEQVANKRYLLLFVGIMVLALLLVIMV
ncbi:tetratricopeptide repeat protein [Psychrobacter arenosus]|uniref:tetratricopeptide repeat protein n=1 Tax=Psychrobacter arenosus TaxID=256326 RepID=UPI001919EA58|nr:tetratricopeptide repeat protein [Psychrobacter arenosus]